MLLISIEQHHPSSYDKHLQDAQQGDAQQSDAQQGDGSNLACHDDDEY